jgi:hypothetical protein
MSKAESGLETRLPEDGSVNTFVNLAHSFVERVESGDCLPPQTQVTVTDIDPPETVVSPEELQDLGQSLYATVELTALLARAYLAGRADQISDMHGDNEERTIKARNLPAVVKLSLMFDGTTPAERRETSKGAVDLFNEQRRMLDPASIAIGVNDASLAEQIATYAESNPVGIYFFKKLGSSYPDFWWEGEDVVVAPRLLEGESNG